MLDRCVCVLLYQKLMNRTELDTKIKRDRRPFSEKSGPCLKKTTRLNALLQKKKHCLKMKATTKLHSNVEIFILQSYSGI